MNIASGKVTRLKTVYKEPIPEHYPELVLPSGQEITLDLLDTTNLEVVHFSEYAPFSGLLTFLKCVLEVLCEFSAQPAILPRSSQL
jgi:hypothetical protein